MRLRSMRTLIALVLGFAILLAVTDSARAADTLTVQVLAQNNSGQSGTATLTDLGDGTTKVVLSLTDLGPAQQPVHIHEGTCTTLNPTPKYPLTSLVNGKSETVVPVALSQLLAQPFAINAHKSAQEVAVYTACGNIVGQVAGTGGASPNLPLTGGGGMARRPLQPLVPVAGLLTLAIGAGLLVLRRRRI
jgi:hypothetical protein